MQIIDTQKEEQEKYKEANKLDGSNDKANSQSTNKDIETEVIEMTKDKEAVDLETLRKLEDDSVLYDIKKVQSWAPTYQPTSYKEQFYFQDNWKLWININNIWVQIN